MPSHDVRIQFNPHALQAILPDELALLEAVLPELLEELGRIDGPDDSPCNDSVLDLSMTA